MNNLFIYQDRESSLSPAVFLTARFLQKLSIYYAFVVVGELGWKPCWDQARLSSLVNKQVVQERLLNYFQGVCVLVFFVGSVQEHVKGEHRIPPLKKTCLCLSCYLTRPRGQGHKG